MTPKVYFDQVWSRCDLFAALHVFFAKNATAALQPDELLRAEWAARVAALDLYIHELVAQNLLSIFEGSRPPCPGFGKFMISADALTRIHIAATPAERSAAFDLEVRTKQERVTYQDPDDIADGVRFISACKLWPEVAAKLGMTTDDVKKRLSLIARRRNKIVHEGDLQPTVPRIPWPVSRADVDDVKKFITQIVLAVEQIV